MQLHDQIAIVSSTDSQVDAIAQLLRLRGFDQVKSLTYKQLPGYPQADAVNLWILDIEGWPVSDLLSFVENRPGLKGQAPAPCLVLAEQFYEDLFIRLHDAGVKDYLVKPVSTAYLMSRVLLALDELHNRVQLEQWQHLLVQRQAVQPSSMLYEASTFEEVLTERLREASPEQPLSLVQLLFPESFQSKLQASDTLKQVFYHRLGQAIKASTRVKDIAGHWPPEGFLIALADTGAEGAAVVQQRLEKALKGQPLEGGGFILQLEPRYEVQTLTQPVEARALMLKHL